MKQLSALALVTLVTSVVAACSDDDNDTASSSTAASTTTSSVAAVAVDNCGVEIQDDDFSAGKALLQDSHLPAGDWARQATPACRWSLASGDMLTVDECVKIADARVPRPTGNAKRTWVDEQQGVRLDAQIELYPSRLTPDVVGRLVANPQFDICVENALTEQAADDPAVEIDDVEVSDFDTGIDPTELDVGFVDGTTVTMNVTRDGETEPVVMRAVMFGIGGVLGSVTATVEGDADEAAVDDLDWRATMRAAVEDMIAAF